MTYCNDTRQFVRSGTSSKWKLPTRAPEAYVHPFSSFLQFFPFKCRCTGSLHVLHLSCTLLFPWYCCHSILKASLLTLDYVVQEIRLVDVSRMSGCMTLCVYFRWKWKATPDACLWQDHTDLSLWHNNWLSRWKLNWLEYIIRYMAPQTGCTLSYRNDKIEKMQDCFWGNWQVWDRDQSLTVFSVEENSSWSEASIILF